MDGCSDVCFGIILLILFIFYVGSVIECFDGECQVWNQVFAIGGTAIFAIALFGLFIMWINSGGIECMRMWCYDHIYWHLKQCCLGAYEQLERAANTFIVLRMIYLMPPPNPPQPPQTPQSQPPPSDQTSTVHLPIKILSTLPPLFQ